MTTRLDYLIGSKVRFNTSFRGIIVIGEVIRIDDEDGMLTVIIRDEQTGVLWGAVSSQLEFVDF